MGSIEKVVRDGKLEDLQAAIDMAVLVNGLTREKTEELVTFYLESGLPLFFRVAGDERLDAALGATLYEGRIWVLLFLAVEDAGWAPVLLWRQLERWGRELGAHGFTTTTSTDQALAAPRFLAAAGLEPTAGAGAEVWMQKEI